MKQILQSFKTGELWLADVPVPLCHPNGVVVKTIASFVSAGTERMLAEFARKGLVGKALQMPDQVRKVLRKIKTEGLATTLEKVEAKLDRPIPLGYSLAGVIVEVGRNVQGLAVGDRVVCGGAGFANHAEYCFVPRNLVVRIPDGVNFEDASIATVASIALQGIRQCELKLGETICVIGLGLLGQIAVQLAKASGCKVIGFDPTRSTDNCLCVKDGLREAALAMTDGYGVDAVLITAATKSNEPVTVASEICRKKGRVVVTGVVGMNLPRDEYYKKEIDFRLSCSYGPGRYDSTYEEGGCDYPYGYVRWTEQRNMQAVLDLIVAGSFNPSQLVTHRLGLDDALSAYELLLGTRKETYLGIILRYGGESETSQLPASARRVEVTSTAANVADNVGISFVGCGNFARSVLLPVFRKTKGVAFRGVCTASGMSCAETARKSGFAFAATDESEVWKDKNTHLAILTTRHNLHAHQIRSALVSGKYVFTEKPLCITEEEIADLIGSGLDLSRVMVGFNRRFSPHARLIKDYFAKRTLPLFLTYRVNAGIVPPDSWIQDPAVGGGRIIGEGCHFVDFMRFVVGAPVVSVHASSIRTFDASQTSDDSLSATIQFADGSIGTLLYVALGDTMLSKELCLIDGNGSTVTMDDFRTTYCSGKLGERKLAGRQQKGFHEELAAVLEAVRNGRSMPIPAEEFINVTQTTFAIRKALRTGETIRVD